MIRRSTYPRVELSKVGLWLEALTLYGLPLLEIENRKIKKKIEKGSLSKTAANKITSWKRINGLDDPDSLEYKYFLQGANLVLERPLQTEDLAVPVSNQLTIQDIIGSQNNHIRIYFLSKQGLQLASYLKNKQYLFYEAMLFWLAIRSKKFPPILQGILSDPRFYTEGFRDKYIPSRDAMSRSLVGKWLSYFSVIDNKKVNVLKLSMNFLFAIIFEMNETIFKKGSLKGYVDEICTDLVNSFSISENAINIGFFLEYLYTKLDRKFIKGFPSGRNHRGLPSKPSIQILEIIQPIPVSMTLKARPIELREAIVFGDL